VHGEVEGGGEEEDELLDKVERLEGHVRRLEMDLEMSHLRNNALENRVRDLLVKHGMDPLSLYHQELHDIKAQRQGLLDKNHDLARELSAAYTSRDTLALQVRKLAQRLVQETRARAVSACDGGGGGDDGGGGGKSVVVSDLEDQLHVALDDLAQEKAQLEKVERELDDASADAAALQRENADLLHQVRLYTCGCVCVCVCVCVYIYIYVCMNTHTHT